MLTTFTTKSLRLISAIPTAGVLTFAAAPEAKAQDAYLGTVQTFGFNFCPRGWEETAGQLLNISSYQALFSLVGTTYGGDGTRTFALPDLRGRVQVGYNQGPGLSRYVWGQRGGLETVTLTEAQMPSHSHVVNANNGVNGFGARKAPGGDFLGNPSYNDPSNPAEDISIYADQAPNVQMDPRMIAPTGGSSAHENRPPYLAMISCIATQGVFPSRN